MSNRILHRSLLITALTATFLSQTAIADSSSKPTLTRIADQQKFSLNINSNISARTDIAAAARTGGAEIGRIDTPDAAFIKVHFDYFKLPAGISIEVSSPDGAERYRYGNRQRDVHTIDSSIGQNGKTSFSSMSIMGPTAVIRLVGQAREAWGPEHGIKVSKYLEGYPPDMIPQLGAEGMLDAGAKKICGTSDLKPVACYESSEQAAYNRSKPVAWAVLNNGFTCTAWRVGPGDKMFTNNHCSSTQSGIAATEMWFNYQTTGCSSTTTATVVKVPGDKLLKTNESLDYTLFTIKNPQQITQFGYLGLDNRIPSAGTEIYIAGHPRGRRKELSVVSDVDGGGYCRILNGQRGTQAQYQCDTEGGNSGSPVMLRSSGRAVVLHNSGSCDSNNNGGNFGHRISAIWPEVASFFNNQLPAGDNEGNNPPPPPPPGNGMFTNANDVAIRDLQTSESAINVTNINGNAPADLKVKVDIKHTYRGDLIVDIVAPDGRSARLHNGEGAAAVNLIQTYTVNASAVVANGQWKLRVYDRYQRDVGIIDSWTLEF